MDYIVPAVLLGTQPATDSSQDDSPPPYGLVNPEMEKKRAYVKRIQYCQTAATFILLPVMLVLQVPFLRFADKHFSPSVAKAIKRSHLRGRLAGSLAFAVADIVPYTGLEISGLTICPPLLPNTADEIIEIMGAEQASSTWACRREEIRAWRGFSLDSLHTLDFAKEATPLVRDLVSYLDHEFWNTKAKDPTVLQFVAKFLGDAAVLLWTIYEEEKERAKLEAAEKKAKSENTPEEEEAALLALRGAASWDI